VGHVACPSAPELRINDSEVVNKKAFDIDKFLFIAPV
jgi:hypothetical protein